MNALRLLPAVYPEDPHGITSEEMLVQIRSELATRYDIAERVVRVGEHSFTMLGVRDTNALLDKIDPVAFEDDERLPYWAELWASSVELARWCLEDGHIADTRILELGCGLGLVGIAAARSGASVMVTDYEPDALLFARYNALKNAPLAVSNMKFRPLDWRAPCALPPFDIVLAADVVYDRKNFSPLLDLFFRIHPSHAIFTDPDRAIGHEFIAQARRRGFQIESRSKTVTMNMNPVTVIRHMIRQGHCDVA